MCVYTHIHRHTPESTQNRQVYTDKSKRPWRRRGLWSVEASLIMKSTEPNLPWSEKTMATHSSTLAWQIPWTEEPGRLQSMGLLGVGYN